MTATDIPKRERCAQSQSGFDPDEQRERENDKTSLVTLNEQLKNLEASLEKSREEICDAFIAVSGEVNQIRPYFRKSGKVVGGREGGRVVDLNCKDGPCAKLSRRERKGQRA